MMHHTWPSARCQRFSQPSAAPTLSPPAGDPPAMLLLLLCLAADWPQWRGTNRDNVATLPGLPDRLPDKLTPRWKQPLGGGYGGISVVGQRVYVMDRRKSPEAERVLCLDAA